MGPSGSAIRWPTFTRSPGLTVGRAGLPMCMDMGRETVAGMGIRWGGQSAVSFRWGTWIPRSRFRNMIATPFTGRRRGDRISVGGKLATSTKMKRKINTYLYYINKNVEIQDTCMRKRLKNRQKGQWRRKRPARFGGAFVRGVKIPVWSTVLRSHGRCPHRSGRTGHSTRDRRCRRADR